MTLELTTVPLQAYLALAAILFCTGVWGLINSRNAVRVLMSIELMLNAVNINLMAFWRSCSPCIGTVKRSTWSVSTCCAGSHPGG